MSEHDGAKIEVLVDANESDYRRVLYGVRKNTILLLGSLAAGALFLVVIFGSLGITLGFPDAIGGYILFALILSFILVTWIFVAKPHNDSSRSPRFG